MGLRGWELGTTVQRRIAALDPVRDDAEICRLSQEVLWGDPMSAHASLVAGFAHQVAIPSIARIIHRSGRGDLPRDPIRRMNSTLVFFGEFHRHGHDTARGREAIARMERIHGRFPIEDDEKLYTLMWMMFDPDRIGRHLGADPFTENEREARFRFWRAVAEHMPLPGVPETRAECWDWMIRYEQEHAAPSRDGRGAMDAFFRDWMRWFPRRGEWLSRHVLLAMLDEPVRTVHELEPPNPAVEKLLRAGWRAYCAATPIRPIPPGRSLRRTFGREWGPEPDLEQVGHQGSGRREVATAEP